MLQVKSVTSTPKCCSSRIADRREKSVSDKTAFESSLLAELRRAIKVELRSSCSAAAAAAASPGRLQHTGYRIEELWCSPANACRVGGHD